MKAVLSFDEDQDPRRGRDVTIIYVGNLRAFAQSYFNANAFPSARHEEVKAAASRFAMLHFHIKLIHEQIERDMPRFVEHIIAPEMKLEDVLRGMSRDRYVAKYDGLELLTHLHGLFYSLKSFLDVYAILLCRLVLPSQKLIFSGANINGREIAGGRFIRWLRNSAPKTFHNAGDLANLLQSESESWISEAVAHRDTLGHYSDIEDIHSLQVPLRKIRKSGDPMYMDAEIRQPKMPDGTAVIQYADALGTRVRGLVQTSLVLFPNVNQELLHYPNFDLNEPDWPTPAAE